MKIHNSMKTKKLTLFFAVILMLVSCGKEHAHEFWDGEYGNKNVGYLAFQLVWDEHDDTLSVIDNVKITVSGADGFLKEYNFSSPADAADQLQQLPEGSYDLLVMVDMTDKDGYTVAADKTDGGLPPTTASLKVPSSSPRQSWFGTTTARVADNEVTIAKFTLKRLLSMFTIVVNGVPDGVKITAQAAGVAQSVELTSARPSVESFDDVALGAFVGSGTLKMENFMLMPTASVSDRMTITLTTTENGKSLVSTIDAPKMISGRYYELTINYAGVSPYLIISETDINDWQQDRITDGEILNPGN